MRLDTMEMTDAADLEAVEAVDLSGMPGGASLRGKDLPGVWQGQAETGEAQALQGCVACKSRGFIPPGNRHEPAAGYVCGACNGVGWFGISPEDPLPQLPGEHRVPYLQVRYHFGRSLFGNGLYFHQPGFEDE